MTPEARDILSYRHHRETWEMLCRLDGPVVVEMAQLKHRTQRQVALHTVDQYVRLGLLRLVDETAGRWRYAVVADNAPCGSQGP